MEAHTHGAVLLGRPLRALPSRPALPDDLPRSRVAHRDVHGLEEGRVIRQMVLSRTEQGKGILRERQLRRMFTLDATPGSLKNNGLPLQSQLPGIYRNFLNTGGFYRFFRDKFGRDKFGSYSE